MSLSKTSKQALESEDKVWKDADDRSNNGASSSEDIEGYSTNMSTSETNKSGTTDDDMQSIKNQLTQKESMQIFCLRMLVIMILLAVSTSISVVIFHMERGAQQEEFESDYYGAAEKIIDALQGVTDSIAAISGVAVTAAVDAQNHADINVTSADNHRVLRWPLVTMEAFQERAKSARTQAGSIFVSLNPIVDPDQLSTWEQYVQSDANSWM